MPAARELFASARSRQAALAIVIGAAVLVVGGGLLLHRQVPWLTDPDAVRAWVRAFGAFAPLAFVLLQAAQVVVAPIPGQVLGLVSGFLFGAVAGTAYSLIGATIGSFVAFTLSRRLGRRFVERIVDADQLAAFDSLAAREGALALFLVFLFPGLPDDVICFVAGLTTMSIPKMVVISFVGRIPGYAAINAAGAGLAGNFVVEAVAALAVLVVVSVLAYRYRDRFLERILAGQR